MTPPLVFFIPDFMSFGPCGLEQAWRYRPRYTPSTAFETFPFPEGLTPDIPAEQYAADPRAQKIVAAAKRLDELRNNWLNPPDLVMRVPEVVEGYPDRILPFATIHLFSAKW